MQELFAKIRQKRPNPFDYAITAVVVLAGVLIGLETDAALAARYGRLFLLLDQVIVGIFLFELLFKIALEGKRPWCFFLCDARRTDRSEARLDLGRLDFWHIFDFFIVVLCLLPHLLPVHLHTRFLPVFRLTRLLRLMRLVEEVPQLHLLVGAMVKSLPSITYICLFMGLHFYAYAVTGTLTFAKSDPAHFGTLAQSMLTLFEVVTGNGFSSLMHDAVERAPQFDYAPWTPIVYYGSFVVVGVTIILNLFVGVITSEMSALRAMLAETERTRAEEEHHDHEKEILEHILVLEKQLDSIKESLKRLRQLKPLSRSEPRKPPNGQADAGTM